MQNKTKKYYTRTQLKELGFSEKYINETLPKPVLKPNPYYRSAAPMQTWAVDIVETAMKTKAFREQKKKLEKRREAADKAYCTRYCHTMEEIEIKIERIKVEIIPESELREETLEAKQEWYNDHEQGDYPRIAADADEKTKERWIVNFIRHNLTQYDDVLYRMKGKVGTDTACRMYRDAVFEKIAEAYPLHKEECERQKAEVRIKIPRHL